MADLTINTQLVFASNLADVRKEFLAGATVTACTLVYKDANNRWVPFDSNVGAGAGANTTDLRGLALHNATNGQPLAVAISDPNFSLGNTLPANTTIYGSPNAGAITQDVPGSGNYPVVVGLPISANRINLFPLASGIPI